MRYRQLGNTQLNVSVIGLGTWQFSGAWGKNFSQTEVDEIIEFADDHGVNLIDTAECYGDHLSEKLIGESVKNKRDKWILATKFGHNHFNGLEKDENWTVEQVALQLEASLKALQTDYIDIYQFHSGDYRHFDNQELWTFLDKKKQQGVIRHLGVSIGHFDNLRQVEQMRQVGAEVLQVVYNPVKRGAENRVLPEAINSQLGVIARVPLASGFMTGKYQVGTRWQEDDVRGQRKPEVLDQELKAANNLLKAKPEHLNAAAWVIAWGLKNPAVHCSIPGIKSVQQLEENLQAAELLPF